MSGKCSRRNFLKIGLLVIASLQREEVVGALSEDVLTIGGLQCMGGYGDQPDGSL
jgi:hypothetical protein